MANRGSRGNNRRRAVLVYHNSFAGPFIFDGKLSIRDNPHIRQLWPIWEVARAQPGETVAGRPVLSLSLALNYKISGLEVWEFAKPYPADADIRRRFTHTTSTDGGASDPTAIHPEGHRRNFEVFFKALDNATEPALNGREARKAVELVLAIYRSAQLNGPVTLPL